MQILIFLELYLIQFSQKHIFLQINIQQTTSACEKTLKSVFTVIIIQIYVNNSSTKTPT